MTPDLGASLPEPLTLPGLYRFAEIVASQYATPVALRDDAVQEGALAGLAAAPSAARASSPRSYITTSVRNGVLSVLRGRPMTGEVRANNGHNRPTETPLLAISSDGQEYLVVEPTAADVDQALRASREQLWGLVRASVPTDAYRALVALYLLDLSNKDASVFAGHRPGWLDQNLRKKILPALREPLASAGYWEGR